mmetsp:Transcript_30246/g.96749  ORF Transcript_30246/g.96749 Transcript_30246/m.96749 type:complete len:314 (-) Transcript_30246:60-1001(-)
MKHTSTAPSSGAAPGARCTSCCAHARLHALSSSTSSSTSRAPSNGPRSSEAGMAAGSSYPAGGLPGAGTKPTRAAYCLARAITQMGAARLLSMGPMKRRVSSASLSWSAIIAHEITCASKHAGFPSISICSRSTCRGAGASRICFIMSKGAVAPKLLQKPFEVPPGRRAMHGPPASAAFSLTGSMSTSGLVATPLITSQSVLSPPHTSTMHFEARSIPFTTSSACPALSVTMISALRPAFSSMGSMMRFPMVAPSPPPATGLISTRTGLSCLESHDPLAGAKLFTANEMFFHLGSREGKYSQSSPMIHRTTAP